MKSHEEISKSMTKIFSTKKDAEIACNLILTLLYSGSSNNVFFEEGNKEMPIKIQDKVKFWNDVKNNINEK